MALFLLLAAGLGVYADLGFAASGFWRQVPSLATPWLVLAFAAGRTTQRLLVGCGAGALTILVGLTSYYGWLLLAEGVAADTILRHYHALLWIAAGAAVGAGAGLLGTWSRGGARLVREASWGAVLAVPVVDLVLHIDVADRRLLPVVAGLVLVTGLLLLWAARTRAVRLVAVVAAGVVLSVALWQAQLLVLRQLFGRYS